MEVLNEDNIIFYIFALLKTFFFEVSIWLYVSNFIFT